MAVLSVPGMTCAHCQSSIEKALAALDAGSAVNVDLDAKTVTVESSASVEELLQALDSIGFEAVEATG